MKNLPLNIWILSITTALASTAAPFFILAGSLLGVELAPKPEWATAPIACVVVGSALTMVPSIYLMNRWGRKNGSFFGLFLLVISSLICAYASEIKSFSILLLGSIILGSGVAFLQQFRFAAIESLNKPNDIPSALSVLLLSSAVAAFIGPEIATYGRALSTTHESYSIAFILLAGVNVAAALVFCFFQNPPAPEQQSNHAKRPILTLIKQPIFLTAVCSAAVGFAVMTFLMTSTPVTMKHFHGHSIEDAKWVIQSHMLAMFLPSLFTGTLIKRFGTGKVIFAGASLYTLVLLVAAVGHEVIHFWWALVLLGIGWNFLFIGGTTLLPQAYEHSERFSMQAINDFLVFTIQAIASMSAGWVLFQFGWTSQLIICIPFVLLAFFLSYTVSFKKSG